MLGLLLIGFGIPVGVLGYIIYVAFIKKRRAFGALTISDDEAVILTMHRALIEDRYNNSAEFQGLIHRLQREMGNVGEVRDIYIVDDIATVAIFGESAEDIYTQVKKVLRHTSFSKNASVVLRYGAPGSRERRTHMAN